MNVLKISSDSSIDNYSISDLNELKINNIENLYKWKYNNDIIEIYGCLDSNNGILNTHKLPPNGISNALDIESDTIDIYGNIYVVKLVNNILCNYNIADYGEFFSYFTDYYDYDRGTSDSDESIDEIDNVSENNTYNTIYHKIKKKDQTINIYELDVDNNIY